MDAEIHAALGELVAMIERIDPDAPSAAAIAENIRDYVRAMRAQYAEFCMRRFFDALG